MGCIVPSGRIHICYLVNYYFLIEKFKIGLCTHFCRLHGLKSSRNRSHLINDLKCAWTLRAGSETSSYYTHFANFYMISLIKNSYITLLFKRHVVKSKMTGFILNVTEYIALMSVMDDLNVLLVFILVLRDVHMVGGVVEIIALSEPLTVYYFLNILLFSTNQIQKFSSLTLLGISFLN